MIEKLEFVANHILTRLFGLALIGGSAFALYEEIITQWPAIGLIVFGIFCVVPTKLKSFVDFAKKQKDAIVDLVST